MRLKRFILCAAILVQVAVVHVAHAGEHAHFAAFFKNTSKADFVFPAVVKGDNIERDLRSMGADMLIFAHSAGIKNGDVWSVQNDTLREVSGTFRDLGIDCELSLKTSPFNVSGLCATYMSGHEGEGQERVSQPILSAPIKARLVWYKVYDDNEHGVAGYFMREIAADFNH